MNAPIEVRKNAKEVYRIQPSEFKGHRFIDMRVWYQNKDGELMPSGKGVAIKPEALEAILEALRAAGAEIGRQAPSKALP